MSPLAQGVVVMIGRVLLCAIFFMAAVGQKIPDFAGTVKVMESKGVPAPQLLLVGAIAFLLAGSASVALGYRARIGATLLLVFLILASYYFHNFWAISDPQEKQEQTIQFMKNLALMGAMLFIIGNGAGRMSLDGRAKTTAVPALPT
ncbi:MAG: DoxX family protein [Planctomycetia bacterium]|nr:DoxX family protein [Planctomycetia bacterium]